MIRLGLSFLLAALLGTSPALAIKGGTKSQDPGGIRRSVVHIKGPGGTQCSGTVIARRLVITAAHCFMAGRGTYQIRSLDPNFKFRTTIGAQVAIHPSFNLKALGTGAPLHDIALLRTATDLPGWIEPVRLGAAPGRGNFIDITAAGYGMARDRRVKTAGTLREHDFAMLDKVHEPAKSLFLIDRSGSFNAPRAAICRGDSGGPVFRNTPSGKVLVGVISSVIGGRGRDCGAVTAVTPISAYRSFIRDMADRAGSKVHFE